MKKIFILIVGTLVSISGFAQRGGHAYAIPVNDINEGNYTFLNTHYSRTTNTGDTETLSNIPSAVTQRYLYSAGVDSGYLTGTDYWGDQSFAERYDLVDTAVTIIGVFAQFGGRVNPASAKTISFNVWSTGAPVPITATYFYSGFPANVLTSEIVPITQLGIGATQDTLKKFLFDSATASITGSFFVGYNIAYNFDALNGDTIGLASSMNGIRASLPTYTAIVAADSGTVTDTLINVQNATQYSDNNWYDNYSQDDSLFNDLAIFPIVIIGNPTGVKGVTRNDLTFFGCYPNPAVTSTNIKFSLARNEDVTIQIMDMAGRTVNTITQSNLSTGVHIIPVNTSAMPAGDYLYLIRTSGGDGMGSKMTVIK